MTTMTRTGSRFKTYDMVCISIFAVLLAVCSWISIPTVVPFTLQTFGVFLALQVLGGKRAALAVTVYILLGAVGVPVFAGFQGGLGVLMGTTGGYILGFLFSCLIYAALERFMETRRWVNILAMILGMAACYTFGTVWFMVVYFNQTGPVGLGAVLSWCVLPFIVPDLIKMALAAILGKRVKKILTKMH